MTQPPNTDASVHRLTDAAIRQILLRQGFWTPDSLLYTLVLGLGIGLLGGAPIWPIVLVYAFLTLVHVRAFRHFPRPKDGWRDFEIVVETERVVARHRSKECAI